MSNSLNSLLERLRQGPVTQGWGAVSAFSRSKLNQLLEQQYIERFQRLSFLPPFMGDITQDERQIDTFSLANIELGPPLLSFSTASLSDSRALLSMNIIAGRCSTRHRGADLSTELASTYNITESMGFKLELEIDLAMVVGEVDRQGKVTLNLSRGVNFHCNLAGDDQVANQRLADFFRQEFEQLPSDRSVFELGMLDLKGYNNLTPTRFRVLTQAAPGARVKDAVNYGDGAVVVFIRLRGNSSDGTFPPNGDFPYLIPDDKLFSATLIVAEDMLGYTADEPLDVLNNLLFPGASAFVESERHQLRDLAVFGYIQPTGASFTVAPKSGTIKAGQTRDFVLRDGNNTVIQATRWEALSLQSRTPQGHGSIDANGRYTAPSTADIGHDTLRVVITATYESAGNVYKASALLLVAFDDVTVTPRVATRIGGSGARPLSLSASTLAGGVPSWSLLAPQYGELSLVGDGAVFSPDARSGKKGLLVQQIEAQGNESKVVSVLLINAQQMLRVDPPYIPRLGKSVTVQLKDDSTLLPGLERRWRVAGGEGSVDSSGRFTASASEVSSSSVVSCDIVRNGVVFSSGYSVIETSELIEAPSWNDLVKFTIKVPGGDDRERIGRLYPNGYQQLQVQITVETRSVDGVGYPLSATEKASMRLVDNFTGQELRFVDPALDGIPENDDETWRVRETLNRFDLAIQNAASEDSAISQAPVTNQHFFLHSRAKPGLTATIHATFQADSDKRWWTSTFFEDVNSTVAITPRDIPRFDHGDYRFEPTRVDGGGGSPNPEPPPENAPDDPFDFHLRTIDYWKLSINHRLYGYIPFETMEFVPVNSADIHIGPNISTILWESEQMAETMFSWTGSIFADPQRNDDLSKIKFDLAVPHVLQNKESSDIEVNQIFEPGKLVVSLHRSDNIPYMRAGDRSRDKLSRDLAVILIDKQGNTHKRRISFLPTTTVGRRNRLMHNVFNPVISA